MVSHQIKSHPQQHASVETGVHRLGVTELSVKQVIGSSLDSDLMLTRLRPSGGPPNEDHDVVSGSSGEATVWRGMEMRW